VNRLNKIARVSVQILAILLVFSLFFIFFDHSNNLTGAAIGVAPLEDDIVENLTTDFNLNETVEEVTEETIIINESSSELELQPIVVNETIESDTEEVIINETIIEEPITKAEFTEIELNEYTLLFNENGESISYELETNGFVNRVYPSLVFDLLEITNYSSGEIVIKDNKNLGDQYDFIDSYVIDTRDIEFDTASFTRTSAGNKVYKCLDWNGNSCNVEWQFVKDVVKGESYSETLGNELIVYGEVRLSNSLGVQGNIGIQSAINATAADGLIV
jgi:hypothetical protein